MKLNLQIEMNEGLFLRDPESSELGKKIIKQGIYLIHQIGFEAFTFKKLAKEIGTTEAGIYRYFENKHLLLLYIVDWYWSWQEYRLLYTTNNIKKPESKLKKAIELLSSPVVDDLLTPHINKKLLYEIIMLEGAKSYLTRHVTEYNKAQLFKPYKDFCKRIADLISEINPKYKYPHSMASTIVEMAHSQAFYKINLPSLTDFGNKAKDLGVSNFLENMLFATIAGK